VKTFIEMAAIKVSEGYLSTGFNIISLDECCLDWNVLKTTEVTEL
jgi:hypothetical protein